MATQFQILALLVVTAINGQAQDSLPDEEPLLAPVVIRLADISLVRDANGEVVKLRLRCDCSRETVPGAAQFLENVEKNLKAKIPPRVREPNR